jgi:hypothetical protein
VKPVRLSNHAQGYKARRGFTTAEVTAAIRHGRWEPAESGTRRWQASFEFPFNALWNGVFYATKRVRPIFVEENVEIVVITVYTYYY